MTEERGTTKELLLPSHMTQHKHLDNLGKEDKHGAAQMRTSQEENKSSKKSYETVTEAGWKGKGYKGFIKRLDGAPHIRS